ncbi:hypothetical protein J6U78_03735 [bacterium]|nr:hypothetical protein [bacterium]
MTMEIMLGNKCVAEIEQEHGFTFADDEREFLKKHWHKVADFKDGECGWHMFDLPPFLEVSNGDIGKKCLDIFMKHNADFKFIIRGGYGNSKEQTDEQGKAKIKEEE